MTHTRKTNPRKLSRKLRLARRRAAVKSWLRDNARPSDINMLYWAIVDGADIYASANIYEGPGEHLQDMLMLCDLIYEMNGNRPFILSRNKLDLSPSEQDIRNLIGEDKS